MILIYAILGNIVIALGIILSLVLIKGMINKLLPYLDLIIAFTVGLLLGIIFLGFIPEVVSDIKASSGAYLLVGLLVFYLLELFLHWHHCKDFHGNKQHLKLHKIGSLMFIGTFLHNLFHGLILFSAFSFNISFGVFTTFAILLHSIPQNITNLIMNNKNYKFVWVAAFGGVFGSLMLYPFNNLLITYKAYLLAIITGGLLYIALSDIFPELNKNYGKIHNVLLILLGIWVFIGFEILYSNFMLGK